MALRQKIHLCLLCLLYPLHKVTILPPGISSSSELLMGRKLCLGKQQKGSADPFEVCPCLPPYLHCWQSPGFKGYKYSCPPFREALAVKSESKQCITGLKTCELVCGQSCL